MSGQCDCTEELPRDGTMALATALAGGVAWRRRSRQQLRRPRRPLPLAAAPEARDLLEQELSRCFLKRCEELIMLSEGVFGRNLEQEGFQLRHDGRRVVTASHCACASFMHFL